MRKTAFFLSVLLVLLSPGTGFYRVVAETVPVPSSAFSVPGAPGPAIGPVLLDTGSGVAVPGTIHGPSVSLGSTLVPSEAVPDVRVGPVPVESNTQAPGAVLLPSDVTKDPFPEDDPAPPPGAASAPHLPAPNPAPGDQLDALKERSETLKQGQGGSSVEKAKEESRFEGDAPKAGAELDPVAVVGEMMSRAADPQAALNPPGDPSEVSAASDRPDGLSPKDLIPPGTTLDVVFSPRIGERVVGYLKEAAKVDALLYAFTPFEAAGRGISELILDLRDKEVPQRYVVDFSQSKGAHSIYKFLKDNAIEAYAMAGRGGELDGKAYLGIMHHKVWLITLKDGTRVLGVGSANPTAAGTGEKAINYENMLFFTIAKDAGFSVFDVFQKEFERLLEKAKEFDPKQVYEMLASLSAASGGADAGDVGHDPSITRFMPALALPLAALAPGQFHTWAGGEISAPVAAASFGFGSLASIFPIPSWVWDAAGYLGVAVGTYYLARMAGGLTTRILKRTKVDPRAHPGISRLASGIIYVVGFLVFLKLLGLTLGQIGTSMGVVTLGVTLAMQRFLTDLLGGFLIFYERDFVIGETIQMGDIVGEVTDLSFRKVTLKLESGAPHHIPNGKFLTEGITNHSRKADEPMGIIQARSPAAGGADELRAKKIQ